MIKHHRQPSVMQHQFGQVPNAEIPRSSFKRSHGYKTTMDSGYLIPIYVDEALPGDTFNVKLSSIARLATPIYPIMDNLHMDFFFFAVPNRLLWDNWQKFMGEQTDPGDSTSYLVPQVTAPAAGWTEESIADYFGIPVGIDPCPTNALHFRAYNLIWNEWFRDENLQDSLTVQTTDGPDLATLYPLQKRGKRHDYFTSCLPWPQKSPDGDVSLPLGTSAPITGLGKLDQNFNGSTANVYETDGTGTTSYVSWAEVDASTNPEIFRVEEDPNNTGFPNIRADLSSATASTINALREAFQLQKMFERDARGGTRYTEIIKSHFRVTSPDFRLQRPEYLGGGSTPIQIQPIPQTSESSTTKQGTLAAIGYHAQSGTGFTKSFVEHSVIIGLANIRADLTYQQGLNKMWSRQTRFDYYWPALSHLGEQEVLNGEIYKQGTSADDDVFGYQERWAEYRYYPSQITGQMRSVSATSLDAWHLSQDFATLPLLDSDFIEENPPVSRVIAVPSEPEFIFDGFFNSIVTRPMPVRSAPGLIDHF